MFRMLARCCVYCAIVVAVSCELLICVAHGRAQDDTRDLASLLIQYRSGDADRAVEALMRLNRSEVENGKRTLAARATGLDLAALGLFLFEGGLSVSQAPLYWPLSTSHPAVISPAGASSIMMGRELVSDSCKRPAINELPDSFCRRILSLMALERLDEVFLRQTASRFPEEDEVQIAVATEYEYWMTTVESVGGYGFGDPSPGRPLRNNIDLEFAAQAESALRRALRVAPGSAEALVRLGHVLEVTDREDQASRLWLSVETMTALEADQPMRYVASLFLGRSAERAHRWDEAAQHYRSACESFGAGQAARAALGSLALRSGRDADGWSVFQEALATRPIGPDPWATFPRGARWWAREQVFKDLRSMVHR